ncbi:MAG: TIGR02452 family protein [Lachnospiraceae bacterium]|nr:TIGR02452 family protein [Lachnospiraceae bacterium]
MGRREDNVEIFEDTTAFVNENEKLKEAVKRTRNVQKIYFDGEDIPDPTKRNGQQAKVVVSGKRTLEAASAYKGKKTCILNFASATNPGGGVVNGSSAQEEAICRCSTLYFVLDTDELRQKFYQPHRRTGNPLYNDDIIYSPEIIAIKSDTSNPRRLLEKDWYKVNVITCAAPNLREHPSNRMNPDAGRQAAKISDADLMVLLEKRVRRIFAAAAAGGNEVLILGAFGCGAFRNPPRIVAKVFHNALEDYRDCFETVEFAVFHTEREMENFRAFTAEFKNL